MCPKHYARWRRHGDPTVKLTLQYEPIEKRYESKVICRDGCWGWSGAVNNHGYAKLGDIYAHRVSWEIAFGLIPTGLDVLHHCDNPPCTRADHLFLGTATDNAADMVRKGRAALAKLTPAQVVEMRAMRQQGVRVRELAVRFNVAKSTVEQALVGIQTWTSLSEGKVAVMDRRFPPEILAEARRLYLTGRYSQRAISKMFGFSKTYGNQLLRACSELPQTA